MPPYLLQTQQLTNMGLLLRCLRQEDVLSDGQYWADTSSCPALSRVLNAFPQRHWVGQCLCTLPVCFALAIAHTHIPGISRPFRCLPANVRL